MGFPNIYPMDSDIHRLNNRGPKMVTTGFATFRIRYVLVRNKFATYYFQYSLNHSRKKIFSYISRSSKLAPPRVQVLDFANRQRDEYVGSELERSEFDK